MVSRSRISPTRMTLGAWRKADRKPAEKVGKSRPNSALGEGGEARRVEELDGVLEGDDVDSGGLVELVQHRGEGGGLAGAGGAGDEDQAGLLLDDLAKDGLELEGIHGGHLGIELADDHGEVAVLAEDIHAEPADALDGVRAIAGAELLVIVPEMGALSEEGMGETLDLLRGQD